VAQPPFSCSSCVHPAGRSTASLPSRAHYYATSVTHSASPPSIASLRAIYQRRPTLYTHQQWVKDYLGLKDVDQRASDELATYLQAHASEVVSVDELVTAAQHWLYEHQLLIPGDRAVRDLARKCYDAVEKAIYAAVTAAVPAPVLFRCHQAIYETRAGNTYTVLEWLKTPPRRHSPTTLAETLDKIAFLKQLGAHEWSLDAIPLEKQRGYAQQMQARRPVKSKEIKEATATIERRSSGDAAKSSSCVE
jgi:hypothetical protein